MKPREELRRQLSKVSIGTSDTLLIGSNPRRVGIVVSPPPDSSDTRNPVRSVTHNVSTATTGVKLSYTVPAGKQAFLDASTFFETAGTGVVAALQVTIGGTTITLLSATTAATNNMDLWLSAGDTVQWNVTTAQAASTSDFGLFLTEFAVASRVTLSFDGTAILDQGININPGQHELQLWGEHIGQSIREEIRAIAAQGTQLITIMEIFEVGCPCMTKEGY